MPAVELRTNPAVSNDDLNELYATAWEKHQRFDFGPVLSRSLVHVCAYEADDLVGSVYVAWDGNQHAFILEPTVRPSHRRRGVGTALVRRAADVAKERGCEWLHVDFAAELWPFYRSCGFVPAEAAGLINLRRDWPRTARQ